MNTFECELFCGRSKKLRYQHNPDEVTIVVITNTDSNTCDLATYKNLIAMQEHAIESEEYTLLVLDQSQYDVREICKQHFMPSHPDRPFLALPSVYMYYKQDPEWFLCDVKARTLSPGDMTQEIMRVHRVSNSF